jgi:hypothetical protein
MEPGAETRSPVPVPDPPDVAPGDGSGSAWNSGTGRPHGVEQPVGGSGPTTAHVVERPAGGPDPAAVAGDAVGPDDRGREQLRDALRPVIGFLANVTVLTALLVYFGWRRSATQAARLGIEESILGMSTRDYVLRSVGPVLVLLVGIGVAGLVWVAIDRRVTPLLEVPQAPGGVPANRPRGATLALRFMGLAWVILPALVVALGYLWPTEAYVLFPASIGAGILLLIYAAHLHEPASRIKRSSSDHTLVMVVFGLLLVTVCLFWTASRFAEVLGRQLADDLADNVDELPGVTAYSRDRLYLEGPGVDETPLSQDEGDVRYRYRGLRLLEHTGGKYFLVSDGWRPEYGVVFVLRDDDESVRVDFVRDRR